MVAVKHGSKDLSDSEPQQPLSLWWPSVSELEQSPLSIDVVEEKGVTVIRLKLNGPERDAIAVRLNGALFAIRTDDEKEEDSGDFPRGHSDDAFEETAGEVGGQTVVEAVQPEARLRSGILEIRFPRIRNVR